MLEHKLQERDVEKRLENQSKQIVIEVDKLWHIYDRDRSGGLDKKETRECIIDILTVLKQEQSYDSEVFDHMYE